MKSPNLGRQASTIATAVLFATFSIAAQKPKDSFKAFVLTIAPKVETAYARKDSAFFDKLYAPNFVTQDEHGVKNGKKIALFLLRYHFNTLQNLTYHAKLLSIDAAGNTGTVKMMTVLQATMVGHHGSKGGPIKVTRIEKEVFVKNGNEWQMSLDQDLKRPLLLQPASPSMTMLKPAGKK